MTFATSDYLVTKPMSFHPFSHKRHIVTKPYQIKYKFNINNKWTFKIMNPMVLASKTNTCFDIMNIFDQSINAILLKLMSWIIRSITSC
jgi:hypothetical protein